MKRALVMSSVALVFFLTGLLVGRLSSPVAIGPSPETIARALLAEKVSGTPTGSGEGSTEQTKNITDQIIESLKNEPPTGLVRSLASWSDDPVGVVGGVIDSMSDDEIMITLSSLTSLGDNDLEDVRDLRQYARRMAQLAVQDLVGQPAFRDPQLPEVYFSREPNPEEAAADRQNEFEGQGRMHAILPMADYDQDRVFVKWTRVDDREVILFDAYPIRQNEEYNWVYLDPKDGWEAGEYSVDFYSADEDMKPLAGGNYQMK